MACRLYFHKNGNGYCKKISLGFSKKAFGWHIDTYLSEGFILNIFWIRVHYKNIISQGGRY